MKVYIGSDHAGFELKGKLTDFLISHGYEVIDKGAYEYNKDDDYPEFIHATAAAVASQINTDKTQIGADKNSTFGIVIGGSGQGEAIVANRIFGIRAALYYGENLEIVKLSREHNDANILSLGARFVTEEEAKRAVRLFLDTPFSGDERHVRRINKIDKM